MLGFGGQQGRPEPLDCLFVVRLAVIHLWIEIVRVHWTEPPRATPKPVRDVATLEYLPEISVCLSRLEHEMCGPLESKLCEVVTHYGAVLGFLFEEVVEECLPGPSPMNQSEVATLGVGLKYGRLCQDRQQGEEGAHLQEDLRQLGEVFVALVKPSVMRPCSRTQRVTILGNNCETGLPVV